MRTLNTISIKNIHTFMFCLSVVVVVVVVVDNVSQSTAMTCIRLCTNGCKQKQWSARRITKKISSQ